MSQASNHVDWCLKKAEKEIEEGKKAGLSPKHRGLIKGKVDIGLAKEHIEKAERYLQITEYLKKGGFQDNCISNIFYAMYHCFLSIAAKFGYDSGNQTCTIALIGHLKQEGKINIDARFTEVFKYAEDEKSEKDSVIELREKQTYGTDIKADESEVNKYMQMAKELIAKTKEIVHSE